MSHAVQQALVSCCATPHRLALCGDAASCGLQSAQRFCCQRLCIATSTRRLTCCCANVQRSLPQARAPLGQAGVGAERRRARGRRQLRRRCRAVPEAGVRDISPSSWHTATAGSAWQGSAEGGCCCCLAHCQLQREQNHRYTQHAPGCVDELCVSTSRVQGYPTIMAFVNGKAAGEYSGERSAGAIKTWALGLVPNHVTTLNKQQQVRPGVCVSAQQAPRCSAAFASKLPHFSWVFAEAGQRIYSRRCTRQFLYVAASTCAMQGSSGFHLFM